MCLAFPGKIVEVEGTRADIDFGGFTKSVNMMLLPDAKIGDYVLVHAGFAISKTTEKDALETLDALRQVYTAAYDIPGGNNRS